jgi:hypothetical protein
MFLHSCSANYNRRTTTPYGMITLICYSGSCTLVGHLLQQEVYAPVTSYCCARTTLQGLKICTNHGQSYYNSCSNSRGRKKHSCRRLRRSGKKCLPKMVPYRRLLGARLRGECHFYLGFYMTMDSSDRSNQQSSIRFSTEERSSIYICKPSPH